MNWFLVALASAFCWATADFLAKRHFGDLSWSQATLARWAGVLPAGLLILVLVPWPQTDWQFWAWMAVALPADLGGMFLYARAIQLSPMSVSLPFLSFTPLFVVFMGWFISSELPNLWGLLGVVVLVAGAYGLNLDQRRHGWLAPFKAMTTEPGSRMCLGAAFLYAFSGAVGRQMTILAGPWFTAGVFATTSGTALLLLLGWRRRLGGVWRQRPVAALTLAITVGLMVTCHFWAISMTKAAYMVAVKRLSTLFVVLYGGVLLKEGRLPQRGLAAGLMVAGAAVISLWG